MESGVDKQAQYGPQYAIITSGKRSAIGLLANMEPVCSDTIPRSSAAKNFFNRVFPAASSNNAVRSAVSVLFCANNRSRTVEGNIACIDEHEVTC
jgi:hypothetical protein